VLEEVDELHDLDLRLFAARDILSHAHSWMHKQHATCTQSACSTFRSKSRSGISNTRMISDVIP
jgi:hypothetical protein